MWGIAIGFLKTGWEFLLSPIGRWVGVCLLVCGVIWLADSRGHSRGIDEERARWEVAVKKAAAKTAKRETKAANIAADVSKDLVKTKTEIQWRTKKITELVPVYVSPQSDRSCSVPVGFVLLHDAAAAGSASLPPAAGGSLDAPSGVQLSTVSATVSRNYGVGYTWYAEAMSWRTWYAREFTAWNAH